MLQDSEDDKPAKNPDHFLEDPAQVRQRAEEKARWKANRSQGQRNKGQGGQGQGQNQGGQDKPKYDVKGGPKGQGQSSEVLRNRRWKTQHKGENRRAMADKKRRV